MVNVLTTVLVVGLILLRHYVGDATILVNDTPQVLSA